jgi:hypothetical protein
VIFDIDAGTILGSVFSALDSADDSLSEEAKEKIINQISVSMPGLVDLMTADTEDAWKTLAADAGGWGTKYAKAIKSTFNGEEGSVFIDESSVDPQSGQPNVVFMRKLELGVKTWSIKAALLASEKCKVGKDGVKYIIIPFPVATPRKGGGGHKGSEFGGREMSSDIHKLVKAGENAPEGSTVTVTTSSGSREVNISGLTQYNTRQLHSQYGIFRRVSPESSGWQYPNISPQPIFDSVIKYVERRMVEVITEFCKQIVEENS